MSSDGDRGAPSGADTPDDVARERSRRVTLRRYKRRLKALAAIGLSLAAGTFLACQRDKSARPTPAPNPTTAEGSNLPGPSAAGAAAASEAAKEDAGGGGGGGDSGHSGAGGKSGHVDRHEHRKGMPVRDNLVE